MIKNILRFMFKGEIEQEGRVRRIPQRREQDQDSRVFYSRFQLVQIFSWVLTTVLLLCLIGVFALLFFDKEIPQFIPQVITGIIGYFGGVLCAYFGIRSGE